LDLDEIWAKVLDLGKFD